MTRREKYELTRPSRPHEAPVSVMSAHGERRRTASAAGQRVQLKASSAVLRCISEEALPVGLDLGWLRGDCESRRAMHRGASSDTEWHSSTPLSSRAEPSTRSYARRAFASRAPSCAGGGWRHERRSRAGYSTDMQDACFEWETRPTPVGKAAPPKADDPVMLAENQRAAQRVKP